MFNTFNERQEKGFLCNVITEVSMQPQGRVDPLNSEKKPVNFTKKMAGNSSKGDHNQLVNI